MYTVYRIKMWSTPLSYRQKVLTWNVTIPSLRTTGISKWSVISVHSCDSSLELKCSIFTWPECSSASSISPSVSDNGRLIFAGTDSSTLFEHEMCRIGPTSIPSTLWSMVGASCTSNKESQNNHITKFMISQGILVSYQ